MKQPLTHLLFLPALAGVLRAAAFAATRCCNKANPSHLGWLSAAPYTTGYFSAVAFYFARDLQARLGVPVGIINSSRGGTCIESREGATGIPAVRSGRETMAGNARGRCCVYCYATSQPCY